MPGFAFVAGGAVTAGGEVVDGTDVDAGVCKGKGTAEAGGVELGAAGAAGDRDAGAEGDGGRDVRPGAAVLLAGADVAPVADGSGGDGVASVLVALAEVLVGGAGCAAAKPMPTVSAETAIEVGKMSRRSRYRPVKVLLVFSAHILHITLRGFVLYFRRSGQ